MFIFRYGGGRAAACSSTAVRNPQWRRSASRIDIPTSPSPYGGTVQVIERCPSPTCRCREMPEGLEIEREQNINGSMAKYAQQVLISTGRSNWKSRIEEEEEGGFFLKQLRGLVGPRGKFSDPYHNVSLTNSSFPPTNSGSAPVSDAGKDPDIVPQDSRDESPASVFLMPSFQYVPAIPATSTAIEAFVQGFVLPTQLHQSHDTLTREQQNVLLRQPSLQKQFVGARKADEILILICGHGGRDKRCGVMGPILAAEFEDKLQRQNVAIVRDPPPLQAEPVDTDIEGYVPTARIGLISHIGGHKWAGNVIIYIPPSWGRHALAGRGIWYGRVEPAHVEGIVAKTVLDGKIIRENFRGGIDGATGDIIQI